MTTDRAPGAEPSPLSEPVDRSELAEQLEELLLGGRRRHTRVQAAELAGISLEQASRLWNALGFASVADDEIAFTDNDVTALANAAGLVSAGLVDSASLQSVTRMVGQSMSQLAEWQARLLLELLAARPELVGADPAGLTAFIGQLEPVLEQVQVHVWRRQLAAASQRLLDSGVDPGSDTLAVGFADLAGYTSLSRQVGVSELSTVLEEFEMLAAELIAKQQGRVVKTIGDEVLFVAGTAAAAAEIALSLQERAGLDGRLPPLRIGLALGSVLARFGDVYGPVVNIASRLTGLARIGTVLVDQQLASALASDPNYSLRRMRPASVRGYQHLSASRLRRSSDNG
ncbi:MAG: adenylate/guanylate cyclase domain-containing protein [Actinomycetota bacterium]|nr:adenylate/guanylate cyclase domain-containing protein [Actinomycetota bacterium]MDQ2956795.1 adenylate/guanylate cyclase domain-containing protein [Actinomycetota bacterium]